MNPRPETYAVVAKTVMLLFVLMLAGTFLKTSQTMRIARAQSERVIENTIPTEVPIKVRIKKEKEDSFKDLKNEKWAREFELELTNTGNKPIYYLDILMVTDVKAADGHRIVFPFSTAGLNWGTLLARQAPMMFL